MYTTESQIDMQRVNVPQLKEFLAFSVKDRYQLKKIVSRASMHRQIILQN
jgi:hypothetical protein